MTTAQLDYLEQATADSPIGYPERFRMAQAAGVVLNVYVPVESDPFSAMILPGSAIVGLPLKYDAERTLVYYEGGKYMIMEFSEKLLHAVDRMVVCYPTVAMATPKTEALKQVGTYDVATKTLHVTDRESLDAWTSPVA